MQVRVNVVGVLIAGDVSKPPIALLPSHPPDAVQVEAYSTAQFSIVELPTSTDVGFAVKLTVGVGYVTSTVTLFVALPLWPVQVRTNVLEASTTGDSTEPDVAFEPLHAPDAVQLVASVEDHVSCDCPPAGTVTGLAVNVRVGTGGGGAVTVTITVCATCPCGPEQSRVNELV